MKILENISNGYKRIAAGIAIVAFFAMMYLALIPGASYAHVYGPDGGILSGVYVFIKEWPQYNATTDIDGTYAINNVPYGEYTLVAMGNDSYAPNISEMYVDQASNPRDITLKAAIINYIPFLYQRTDNLYKAGIKIYNNGTSNASVEIPVYDINGNLKGNEFSIVRPNELLTKEAFSIAGSTANFLGPAYIKSDIPVQTEGYIYTGNYLGTDYQVYSIGPSFSEASTTSYIPFLYNRPSDNLYDAGVIVFNKDNAATASVTIKLYEYTGILRANNTYLVGPKNESALKIFDMYSSGDFLGAVEITSNLPVVSQGFIRTVARQIYSIAPSIPNPGLHTYIPFLYSRPSDSLYDAGVFAYNPGDVTANVTINLYEYTGILKASNSYLVGPKKELANKVSPTMYTGGDFLGSAEVISNQSIVAQGFIRTLGVYNVYSIAPQVNKPATPIETHIPYLYYTANGSHDAGVLVLNSNDGVSANITTKLYYPNGTLAGSYTEIVAPNAMIAKKVNTIVPSNLDFDGSLVVTSNQSVVAQGYIRKQSTAIYTITPPVER